MKEFTYKPNDSLVWFGKYKKDSITWEELLKKDFNYFIWIYKQTNNINLKEHLKNILESKTNK